MLIADVSLKRDANAMLRLQKALIIVKRLIAVHAVYLNRQG
jgi:hypothetical protein